MFCFTTCWIGCYPHVVKYCSKLLQATGNTGEENGLTSTDDLTDLVAPEDYEQRTKRSNFHQVLQQRATLASSRASTGPQPHREPQ